MKIQSVTHNNRKRAFQVKMSKKLFQLPYSKVDPQPGAADPITRVFADKELGNEGFTYVLESGKEGAVHSEQVLEYNQDPHYLRDALLYKLTIEAQKRVEASALSKREIIRRLKPPLRSSIVCSIRRTTASRSINSCPYCMSWIAISIFSFEPRQHVGKPRDSFGTAHRGEPKSHLGLW